MKTTSTSTGASRGRTGTPTADRACRPDSPKISPSSSLAPLTDGRLARERGVGRHESGHLEHAGEAIDPSGRVGRCGHRVECAQPRVLLRIRRRHVAVAVADLARRGEHARKRTGAGRPCRRGRRAPSRGCRRRRGVATAGRSRPSSARRAETVIGIPLRTGERLARRRQGPRWRRLRRRQDA